jgi:hypothetical protein
MQAHSKHTYKQARSQGGAHSARAPPLTKNRLEEGTVKKCSCEPTMFFPSDVHPP